MNASRLELAARNNAIWCDSVCRAHGVPGEFLPALWLNRNTPPPYHPNLVVISASADRRQILASIRELIDLPLAGRWSVKDSFSDLELGPLGFDVLFAASWIWRDPAPLGPGRTSSGIRWRRIVSPEELARWESAWAGDPQNLDASGKPAQFPAALLEDRQIVFFAGALGREIIAGGIANRTGAVVGLSNIFVNAGDITAAWSGLINCVQEAFPALPIVGYTDSQRPARFINCQPNARVQIPVICPDAKIGFRSPVQQFAVAHSGTLLAGPVWLRSRRQPFC